MRDEEMLPFDTGEDIWSRLSSETRPLIIYGMGNGADKLLAAFAAHGLVAADFVASDGFVRGQVFHGKRVLSFSEVREKYPQYALVLAFGTSRAEVLDGIFSLARQEKLYVPDLPVVGEELFDAAFYHEHFEDFKAVFLLFEDEMSRELYTEILRAKLTGDPLSLERACTPDGATRTLMMPERVRSYVDAGAYTGDTLSELIAMGAPLREAVCIEPDAKNYKKLKAYADTLTGVKVSCIQAALWNEAGEGVFQRGGNRNSSLMGASYEAKTATVPLLTLDEILGDEMPDLIKYDVEGAEEEALLGSRKTLERARPTVLLSVYHRPRDLYALPLLLARLTPDYRYYIRRKKCLPAWETLCIAVPKEKGELHDA